MDISPMMQSPVQYNYNAPTPVGAVAVPQHATPSAVDMPETGVILQFAPKGEPKSGNYSPDGLPVEDSKRIQMNKARTKEENEPCQACSERKYQDGSDDMGVSFKTPTSIAPGAAASLVRAHEQEHVSRNATEARESGLTAMSSVTIHTDICPECKKVYVSGGTTLTQFKPDPAKVVDAYAKQMGKTLSMLMGA